MLQQTTDKNRVCRLSVRSVGIMKGEGTEMAHLALHIIAAWLCVFWLLLSDPLCHIIPVELQSGHLLTEPKGYGSKFCLV